MIKIEVGNGKIYACGSGSIAEISADLVKGVQGLREGFADDTLKEIFDLFLKDVFVDLVFTDGNTEKMADILEESIRRYNTK